MHKEKEFILRLLKSGIEGYVLKDSGMHEFKAAIENVLKAEKYIDANLPAVLMDHLEEKTKTQALLSSREIEIIKLISIIKHNGNPFFIRFNIETIVNIWRAI